jgi:O-antigen/teichoic acid export membrane protein
MRFVESVAITFTNRIIIVFIGIVSSIITARWLGPAGKGTLAVLWIIVGLGVQFGNFGFHSSNVYFIARDKILAPRIASNSLWFGLTIGLLISVGIICLYRVNSNLFSSIPFNLLLVTVILIPFKLLLLFFQNIFLGLQKLLAYNSFELAERSSLLVVLVLVLILLKQGLSELMVFILIITGILTAFFTIYTKRMIKFSFSSFDTQVFANTFRYGLKVYLACFFSFLVIRSDMILVNYFRGASASGIYSIAVNFSELLYLLPVTIGAMLFPKVSANIADDGIFTQKISRLTVLLMAIICILVAIVCRPLILLMYGRQFTFSAIPLLWLLPGIFFLSLATIYNNDLAGRGYPPVIIYATATAFILNFGLNLLFIPRYGITGAAITSSVSYFVMFIIVLSYSVKIMHSRAEKFLIPSFAEIRLLFQEGRKKLRAEKI